MTALAPAAPACAESGHDSAWRLVWSDEFEGSEIDGSKWGFDVDCWGGGNNEQQCYTDRESNAAVKDGLLLITARRERHVGPGLPSHMRQAGVETPEARKPYTSARLTTRGKAAWQYGKIEVRTRLPQGQGIWPAIWMLPENENFGRWAASGEIDILEAVNLGVECDNGCEQGGENTILGTLHFGGQWPDNAFSSTEIEAPQVLSGFHTFGVIWENGRIRWTLDGDVYAQKSAGDWWTSGSGDAAAPFNAPFHLILNLAVGGGLPEGRALGGVSDEGFPKQLEIDWVRVWQCDSTGTTNMNCNVEGGD